MKMEFRLDKCAKTSFVLCKLTAKKSIQIDIDITIKQLEAEEFYNYLGINEVMEYSTPTWSKRSEKNTTDEYGL